MDSPNLKWQSRLVLLLVVAPVVVSVALSSRFWIDNQLPQVTIWSLSLSALLGLAAWKSRSATPAAALAGALLNACLMLSTVIHPYRPWKTLIIPVLVLLVITSLATRFGRGHKERLSIAEERHGRNAAQVCANLGVAALMSTPEVPLGLLEWFGKHPPFIRGGLILTALTLALAALAEAVADTVSSEIGQVLGGTPLLLTTLRRVPAGTDGAISLAGTSAGIVAAALVTAAGTLAIHGNWRSFTLAWSGGVFGLIFDSLLGATIERKGWLNNDAVNFLSTASAAGFVLAIMLYLR